MATQPQDSYELLVSSNDPSFEEFYRIYAESMPIREQKPKSLVSAMVTQHDYKILLLKRNDGAIGFSVVFMPLKESFCLLEYMAIDAAYRNSGLGRQLFLRTVQDVVSNRGNIPVLLEVDSDRELSADRAVRRRRQQFYERLGCFRVDGLSYVLPLPGQGPPPQMDLMVYLEHGMPLIRKSQLEHWLKVVYRRVYNCSNDDPRIFQMMGAVADPVGLVSGPNHEEKL